MESSPVLLLKPQVFLVLLLLSLMCMILLKVLLEGCHIVYLWVLSWRESMGKGGSRMHEMRCHGGWRGMIGWRWRRHKVHAMETLSFMLYLCHTPLITGYIPKVHEEDLVDVVLRLVGNGVEEESLEHVGYAQTGEQHHGWVQQAKGGNPGKSRGKIQSKSKGIGESKRNPRERATGGKDPVQVQVQGKGAKWTRQKHKVPKTKMIGNSFAQSPTVQQAATCKG
ncbi:hypothetical protein EDD16DRAFT_1525907 [Pisolithus croceorrhizus]|nr:hypothetical protein EDD16DRAFT_1525907 [Pisolithus croceorrhizus]